MTARSCAHRPEHQTNLDASRFPTATRRQAGYFHDGGSGRCGTVYAITARLPLHLNWCSRSVFAKVIAAVRGSERRDEVEGRRSVPSERLWDARRVRHSSRLAAYAAELERSGLGCPSRHLAAERIDDDVAGAGGLGCSGWGSDPKADRRGLDAMTEVTIDQSATPPRG